MNLKQYLLLLAIAFPILVNCQDAIGCFRIGECMRSLVVDYDTIESVQKCLEYCRERVACKHFTFHEETQFCMAFSNCIEFSTTSCTDCVSGDSSCSDLQCSLQGHCDGTIDAIIPGSSASGCLTDCQVASDNCQWISFNSSSRICFLMEDCVFLDKDCSTCVTAQRYCSSVQFPSTTTNSMDSSTSSLLLTTEFQEETTHQESTEAWTEFQTTHEEESTTVGATEFTCGSDLTDVLDAALISPNYPNNYDNYLKCQSLVTSSDSNKRIQAYFTDFEVEACPTSCNCDKLELRDGSGPDSPLLFSGCGNELPNMVVTTSNQLFVSFETDFSGTSRGWKFYILYI